MAGRGAPTLTATDSDDATGADQVTITVEESCAPFVICP